MLYILAIFCSPLAVLFCLKPFQFLFNSALYVFAIAGVFLFIIPGTFFWALGFIHACVVIAGKNADRRADRIIRAYRKEQMATAPRLRR